MSNPPKIDDPYEGIRNARGAVSRIHDYLDQGVRVELKKDALGYTVVLNGTHTGYDPVLCGAMKKAGAVMDQEDRILKAVNEARKANIQAVAKRLVSSMGWQETLGVSRTEQHLTAALSDFYITPAP